MMTAADSRAEATSDAATDGVIKYTHDFVATTPFLEERIEDLRSVRARLFALGLVGFQDGVGYGNLSQRQGDGFMITGTQTGHITKVDGRHFAFVEEWDEERFYLRSSGVVQASSEAITHGTLYRIHSEIGAVIHIHSAVMWEFMLAGAYPQTGDVPYGTPEMTSEVVRLVSPDDPFRHPAFAMAGHEDGIVAFGVDLQDAEHVMLRILRRLLERR